MEMQVKMRSFKVPVIQLKDHACHKALEECAEVAESSTKIRCPVDTGALRQSYTHISDSTQMVVGTNVEYGKYQELGTSTMSAQPHLRPAFESHIATFKTILFNTLSSGAKGV